MQTTLTIDDDVLTIAEQRAAASKTSVGQVISKLTRQGLAMDRLPFVIDEHGIPMLRASGREPVTMELVNELRDDLP